ncbi:DUF6289 family protein [Luteimonas aquatica]|uniref:DUF6289 family protein n=1 Tax=Luteimonas aquatica TaxID=450364 RepID=UPI001F58FCBF|nr:DUF6289 family protein [Luteimonas aquatica]
MRHVRSLSFAGLLSCAALLSGAVIAGPPGQWYTTSYYADVSKSGDPVGGNHADCGGFFQSWGETSPYYTRVFGDCR